MCGPFVWQSAEKNFVYRENTLLILKSDSFINDENYIESLSLTNVSYCLVRDENSVILLVYSNYNSIFTVQKPASYVTVPLYKLCEVTSFLDECMLNFKDRITTNEMSDLHIGSYEQLINWVAINIMMGCVQPGFCMLLDFIRKKETYLLCRYLIKNRCSCEKVQILCQKYGLSYSYFRKMSKRYFGRSAKKKLSEWRLAQTVLDILENENSITDIALKNGFSSSAHVCSTFKSTLGLTPYQIRKINEK